MAAFERVVQILDDAIGGPGQGIGVHGAFWRGLTRDQFVSKKVFERELIVVGDGASSDLVRALKGEAPFGADLPSPPPEAQFSRMPAGRPAVSPEDVALIEKWIDAGCPDDAVEPASLSWRPTNAPPASTRTDDIWFLDPQVGWAVNSNGQILRTSDGGNSWEEQFQAPPGVYLRCVGFASDQRGWVGTLAPIANNRMFETSDGGTTWNRVTNLPPLSPARVCGLSVVNESVVYAAGTNYPVEGPRKLPPAMMKTTDGGSRWSAWHMSEHASLLVDTYFSSPESGWVVGGKAASSIPPGVHADHVKAVVLSTDDGGQTWVNRVADLEQELPLGEWGWKIQFLDDQVGFVSLESDERGAILKTIDGGETWERVEVNDPQRNVNLEGVGFIDEDHGWVGGWGSADFSRGSSSATTDGGESWRDANDVGAFINRFRFFGTPVTVGYAAGRTVYKYSAEPVRTPAPRAGPPTRFLDSNEPTQSTRPIRIPINVPPDATHLAVDVWERFGEHVGQLVDELHPEAGGRTLEWDPTDAVGDPLSADSFIVRVTLDGHSESLIVSVKP